MSSSDLMIKMRLGKIDLIEHMTKLCDRIETEDPHIQAFVPNNLLDQYVSTLEHVYGPGSCHKLFIRPQGAVKVDF